ncbi:hypothetical protein CHUAL_004753 [Chamberlinius hualienensis]
MISNEHALELINVSYTGQIDGGSYCQKMVGLAPTGVILRDVFLEVHGGEVMAILGSKGSGKRALLDVIARRAPGKVKGGMLLNNVPITKKIFQESCGLVVHTCDLIDGLTVQQTLMYAAEMGIGSKVSNTVKRARVKQVMADLALNQVGNRDIKTLSTNEYRRLSIATHLIRDPVALLLDEPTYDLDPLNTYFIISILSNYAKKYNRIMLLTMEKPRSDIFPFLDRVTYLCLGDVVYTGSTRMMLDYFRNIGFPCPELENPLMYYLCLSTVDRRSRDRLMDSTSQIAILVQKFKSQGYPFRKFAETNTLELVEPVHRIPLTYFGMASVCSVLLTLLKRPYRVMANGLCAFNTTGLLHIWLRLLLLPIFFLFIFLFYFRLSDYQRSFISRNGLLFNCMAVTSFLSVCITAVTFAPFRTRFYQENRVGLYRGPLFILSQIVCSFPLSLISVLAGSAIIYWSTGLRAESWRWIMFSGVLWCCYSCVELQTMILMLFVKSSYNAAATGAFLNIFYLVTSSGTVRTLSALPDWLYYLSYVMVFRYAGAFLNENEFGNNLIDLPSYRVNQTYACDRNSEPGCAFVSGNHYLNLRFRADDLGFSTDDYRYFLNFWVCFIFYGGMIVVNTISYLMPLPAFIKNKFRE